MLITNWLMMYSKILECNLFHKSSYSFLLIWHEDSSFLLNLIYDLVKHCNRSETIVEHQTRPEPGSHSWSALDDNFFAHILSHILSNLFQPVLEFGDRNKQRPLEHPRLNQLTLVPHINKRLLQRFIQLLELPDLRFHHLTLPLFHIKVIVP